ncbi:hypothetical protein Q3H58_003112 [Pseudomonas psychrotolerans]|nr:hypothetical protein [Pseudomonas psychrotolerans]
MDIKRPLLIAALAIVSYTMVFQWNKDYGQAELPTAKTQTSVLPGDTPNVPTDVPAEAKAAAPVDNATAKPSTALIKVRTDVLDLAIDPRGGDIVQLGLVQYPQRQDHPDVPFTLFDNGNGHLYLAQSGLTGTDGPDANSAGRPLYTSAQSSYVLADGQQQLVVDLKYQAGGVDYLKRFTFHRGLKADCTAVEKAQKKINCINPDAYEIQVSYLIDNKGDKPWQGVLYAQIKRDDSKDPSATTATGVSTYLGAAVGTPSEPYRKVSMSDMDKHRLQENVQGGWVGWLQHYFVTAWVPTKDQQHQIYTRKDSQGNYIIGFTGPQLTVAPGGETQTSLTLYAGPKIQSYLKMLSAWSGAHRRLRLPVVHRPADLLAAATYPQHPG